MHRVQATESEDLRTPVDETYPAMHTSVRMGCYNGQTHRPGFPELCASRAQELHSETPRLCTYGRRGLLDSCHDEFPLDQGPPHGRPAENDAAEL